METFNSHFISPSSSVVQENAAAPFSFEAPEMFGGLQFPLPVKAYLGVLGELIL